MLLHVLEKEVILGFGNTNSLFICGQTKLLAATVSGDSVSGRSLSSHILGTCIVIQKAPL